MPLCSSYCRRFLHGFHPLARCEGFNDCNFVCSLVSVRLVRPQFLSNARTPSIHDLILAINGLTSISTQLLAS